MYGLYRIVSINSAKRKLNVLVKVKQKSSSFQKVKCVGFIEANVTCGVLEDILHKNSTEFKKFEFFTLATID